MLPSRAMPRARLAATIAASLATSFALLAASCGGDVETIGPDEFAERMASVYCTSIASCCQRFGEPFVETDCEATAREWWQSVLDPELARPHREFDGAAAEHCIDAYRKALTACTDEAALRATYDTCATLFKGTVEPGGECVGAEECRGYEAGSFTCSSGPCDCTVNPCYCVPGTCDPVTVPSLATQPHAALGEPCAGTCDTGGCTGGAQSETDKGCWLNDGLACNAYGACDEIPGFGEACHGYCAPGFYCGQDGLCATPHESGSCASQQECAQGWYCDYINMTCSLGRPDGSECHYFVECLGGACTSDHCRAWSVASPTACAGQG